MSRVPGRPTAIGAVAGPGLLAAGSILLRRTLPPNACSLVRRLGTALLTPVVFSRDMGHFRSSLLARAVDRAGRPLPWYTYPTIHFLQAKSFAGRRVLEWGAGQSTLWWASRAASVTSFESDADWFEQLKAVVPPNVDLRWSDDRLAQVGDLSSLGKFDVVVIDGLDRLICAEHSLSLASDDGAIILDNSEGFWGREGTYPIMDLFRDMEFKRLDFYGYAPGVIKPHCTSLFFRGDCFLLTGQENPVRLP